MIKSLVRMLFDWVFVLLFGLLQGFLNLVKFMESFFDVFAGTAKIFYKGDTTFLINIFFGHDAVTNAFWAMALIAIVLAFGFCIFQMARKASDVTGAVKQSVGQIFSSFIRCLVIILLLNSMTVATINITNVLLDRINFALENAAILDQQETDKTFTDQEYAAMVKILATVANYSANPSSDSRYNVNSCFNAIRNDLLALHVNGFFRYDYDLDKNGHYTWQGALALLASSADLSSDLNLDTYYPDVVSAFKTVSRELDTYKDFSPVETAHTSGGQTIDTDVLIFLITGMEAAQNKMYNNGDFNDTIRKGYVTGKKSYNNLKQVRRDFDIWEIDYLVGYISCLTFVIIMAICIFTFIVRLFNLVLLYLTAPLFASSMPLDEGAKWQSWTQAFAIQLFSGFGLVIAMRIYLIIIPIAVSSDLVFFSNSAILNRMAQLLLVLGGAWAVLQSGDVITGILAGNPGMAAIHQSGRIGSMVTGWALRAPRAALNAAKDIASVPLKTAGAIKGAQSRHEQGIQARTARAGRTAQMKQNKADALYDKAQRQMADGKSDRQVQRTMSAAGRAQGSADKAAQKASGMRSRYGLGAYESKPTPTGTDHAASGASSVLSGGSGPSDSGVSVPGRAASDATSDAAVLSGSDAGSGSDFDVGAVAAAAIHAVSSPGQGSGTGSSGAVSAPVAPPPPRVSRAASAPSGGSGSVSSTGGGSVISSGRGSSAGAPVTGRSVSAPGRSGVSSSGTSIPSAPPPPPSRGRTYTAPAAPSVGGQTPSAPAAPSVGGTGTPPPPPPRVETRTTPPTARPSVERQTPPAPPTPPTDGGSTPPRRR